jgi:uncharacterized membrane protein YdfJ with MMPL/SSD domain
MGREFVPADLIQSMTVGIVLGRPKPTGLTDYQSQFYDNLVEEIAEIQARGHVVEVVRETPDVVLPASQSNP